MCALLVDGKTVSLVSQALFYETWGGSKQILEFPSILITGKYREIRHKDSKTALEMLFSRWLRGSMHADSKFTVLKSA